MFEQIKDTNAVLTLFRNGDFNTALALLYPDIPESFELVKTFESFKKTMNDLSQTYTINAYLVQRKCDGPLIGAYCVSIKANYEELVSGKANVSAARAVMAFRSLRSICDYITNETALVATTMMLPEDNAINDPLTHYSTQLTGQSSSVLEITFS
jgi:hypothetical protein